MPTYTTPTSSNHQKKKKQMKKESNVLSKRRALDKLKFYRSNPDQFFFYPMLNIIIMENALNVVEHKK